METITMNKVISTIAIWRYTQEWEKKKEFKEKWKKNTDRNIETKRVGFIENDGDGFEFQNK